MRSSPVMEHAKSGNLFMFTFLAFAFGIVSGCASYQKTTLPKSPFEGLELIGGMRGCENLRFDVSKGNVYVTDCTGSLYLLDGLRTIRASLRLGTSGLGVSTGPDGIVYVAASGADWAGVGGKVYKVAPDLSWAEPLTGDYPGINGLAVDDEGNLYFASGNLNMLSPKGSIYVMRKRPDGSLAVPEILVGKLKSPNGLFFDRIGNRLLFTETFSGVSTIDLSTMAVRKLFGKTKIVEGFDDLCADSEGSIWVADPPGGFIKRWVPSTGKITRFVLPGFGQASSCRVVSSGGSLYLAVSELVFRKDGYDGRGILLVPMALLERKK